ncbi:hypothetical protein BC349_15300 [Flavihumibacter stibioxidans]|uniref:DUF2911 domain-containing protein n=1 Tax=Flavihumibacter stibioxidans TaxID=1834163 RepID=A0ABR7MCR7_9BACT|nr:DUF2911 domain-containing protein [Flavihumibacter stibioxidans]MBC6492426.1 hypothetical protein [Flavihumibacter stibioxidans]
MKKLILSLSFAICLLQAADAQQLRTPAPSPATTIKQEFALSNVEVSYSRPAMRGRKVFGDLVPFGKVWRTGANNATTITFGEDVMVGDKAVPAGKYGLLTIPGPAEWTVILSKQLDVTSPAAYKQDQDVARITVKAEKLPISVENFMILFDNVQPTSMNLEIVWENTGVSVPVKADIEKKIMSQIDNLMNKDNRPYFAAAMYYLENGKDLNKALGWFDKAVEQNPSFFWVHHQRANCLAKLGKKQEAIAAANKSIELAKAAKNDDYVALNEKLLATLK